MSGNAALLRAETTRAWLGQFKSTDQHTATELLRAMTLVSRDSFAERLRSLILQRLAGGSEPVGLYAERELGHRNGVPFQLFKEPRTKVKRAFGVGPQPVKPTKSYDADVGSEGLIAQLVSELCREYPKRFFNHPGPNQIRKCRIRRFILVTDFVGSGKRARTYIEAAWRVRSVRSWWSARAKCGMAFEVIAYAATPVGRREVESHPSMPTVHVVAGVPTINTYFAEDQLEYVRELCIRYSPVKKGSIPALGFGDTGALIAFAHGVPNNAPLILHKRGGSWLPLFPVRVTSATRATFENDGADAETVRLQLKKLNQARLAAGGLIGRVSLRARKQLLTMAALARPPRSAEAISRKTGLTIVEVEQSIADALSYGWIDGNRRLTDVGQAQMAHMRKKGARPATLPTGTKAFYYPSSLRAPSGSSS